MCVLTSQRHGFRSRGIVGYIFCYLPPRPCTVTHPCGPIRCAWKRKISPPEAYVTVWWMETPVFTPRGGSPRATHKRPRGAEGGAETAVTPPSKASRSQSPGDLTRCMGRLSCPVPGDKDTILVLPRTAVGLNTLYTVISRDSSRAVQENRGHWLCDEQRSDVELLTIKGKDQYETPNYVWRRLIELENINFDACATPFSAVSSTQRIYVFAPGPHRWSIHAAAHTLYPNS